jgi:hypothetical protein
MRRRPRRRAIRSRDLGIALGAQKWLRRLGVDPTLAAWFRRHLVLHVAVALLNLAKAYSRGRTTSMSSLPSSRRPMMRTRGSRVRVTTDTALLSIGHSGTRDFAALSILASGRRRPG